MDPNELASLGDRIGRAVYRIRPGLCYQSTPPAGGDGGQGGGGGTPAPAPASSSGTPPATPPAGGGQPDKGAGGTEPPSLQAVPYERFKEVNDELQRRKTADAERERQEKEKKGEWETLAKDEKAKTEAAEKRAERLAVRSAFVSSASGKLVDPIAAFTLAEAGGLTKDLKPDGDDNVDPKEVGKVIDKVLEQYPYMAATGNGGKPAPFGQPAGGQGQAPPSDPSKLSTREKMTRGLEQEFKQRGITIPSGRGATTGQ